MVEQEGKHYVRDKVEDGTIRLDYLNTKDMLADILTKSLQKAEHARFSALLGLRRRQIRINNGIQMRKTDCAFAGPR
jgi:hypothetical protein